MPDSLYQNVTYDYDCDGIYGDKYISCTISFGVILNEQNFPDYNFRTLVAYKIDTDDDYVLSREEIDSTVEINVESENIADLTGIEHFTHLERLNCADNDLTSLDISENKKLEYLNISSNCIPELDLTQNTMLQELYCDSNNITETDISSLNSLTKLDFTDNKLTELNVSSCTLLEVFECESNKLTQLDLRNNTLLRWFYCRYNFMTSLDLSANTALDTLYADGNYYTIDVYGNKFDLNKMPEGFDISKVTSWTNASADGNILTIEDTSQSIYYTYDTGYASSNTKFLLSANVIVKAINGDADGNRIIDISDATEVLNYYASKGAGIEYIFSDNTDEHNVLFSNADIDADGSITIQDASYILTYYAQKGAGMEPSWDNIIAK